MSGGPRVTNPLPKTEHPREPLVPAPKHAVEERIELHVEDAERPEKRLSADRKDNRENLRWESSGRGHHGGGTRDSAAVAKTG